MSYLEDYKAMWDEFVPPDGQAATVQGELLRAVEKLRGEAIRNGNGNWDRGFSILLRYLRTHLLDATVFPEATRKRARAILRRLSFTMWPVTDDEIYDWLSDRVIDYYRHHGSKPHTSNPKLWR